MSYRKLKVDGKTVYAHRHRVEQRLGRKLARTEQVHHKNEDKRDNSDDNLEVKTPLEHGRHHFAKNPIVKTCEACGRRFEPPQPHRKRDRACSMPCRDVLIMRARLGEERFARLDIAEIRNANDGGESLRSIGRRYAVNHHTIERILAWSCALAEHVDARRRAKS